MGKKLFIVVTLLFGTLLFAQFTEGEADFKLLDGKAPALTLKGWSLNKVKLVPSAAVEEAVLSVTRTEEGDDILSLKAPQEVMIHYFFDTFIPAQGSKDKIEVSLAARGKGVVMLGFYNFTDGDKWLRTNANYRTVSDKWKTYDTTFDIPLKSSGMVTKSVRVVIGCHEKSNIEIKNIKWKLIKPAPEEVEIPSF